MSSPYDPDLLDYLFWARNVKGLADNTLRVRMDVLRRLYEMTGRPLLETEPGHLLNFERLVIAGRAAETRKAYSSHIRGFFRWAKQQGMISEDPSEILTNPHVPKHLPRPIDEEDLNLVLGAARPKMRAMITLAAFSGLRCCEIAGLSWDDLRREPDGTTFINVRQGKGAKQRQVEVGETVVKALQAYGVKRRGAMFIGQDGRQIGAKSVSASINRFLRNHGVPATAHQLRHRYGTIAYQLSRDLRLVQDLLGHASPSTTAGYARPSAEAAARMVKLMDQFQAGRRALTT